MAHYRVTKCGKRSVEIGCLESIAQTDQSN